MDSYSIFFKAALTGGQARTLQLSCMSVSLEGGGGRWPHSFLPGCLQPWPAGLVDLPFCFCQLWLAFEVVASLKTGL